MFTDIEITGYRGISHCEITGLRQINLFFGKNNCGKSSVLESVFLLAGPSNPLLPIMMNSSRGISEFTPRAFALEFHRPNPHNEIHISGKGDAPRTLKIEMIKVNDNDIDLTATDKIETSQIAKAYGFATTFTCGDSRTKFKSQILVDMEDTTRARRTTDERYQEKLIARFVSSRTPSNLEPEDYKIIVENKDEKTIIDILRIIDPRVIDIQLVGNDFLVDIGSDRRLPVNVMGDGFFKIFNILLSIYYCSNGILIIDEIDNGFHFSVMKKLWEAIYRACEKLNVQLFTSTHSYDLIKAFSEAFAEDDQTAAAAAAYKLIRMDDDEIKSIRYDLQQLKYSLEQDIEMR